MTTEATPGNVPLSDQLGTANEGQPLVQRLRTDVLWHQRRGNETIARDCQEAADEIERLRELADSEGTRAVECLRRARKAEEERDQYRAQFLAAH